MDNRIAGENNTDSKCQACSLLDTKVIVIFNLICN